MSPNLDSLNENQREAVLWGEGPLLVLAGPGSGKTRVLTFRVARLLQEESDASVLALTFTNKAASEMRERVDQLLGLRGDRAQLCTFHSFAADILRQHGSHLGVRPDFSILTQEEDRVAVIEPLALELAESSLAERHPVPTDLRNLLALVDRLFADCYDGGVEAPTFVQTPEWLPSLFASYCRDLLAGNRLDFGSLLHFSRKLLRENAGVARIVRLAWTYVCVDEFQDTNKAQYDLLRLLLDKEEPNLFVVADDDQIIYQWNGASPERLQALRSDYQMELIQLPQNYRCPRAIIDLANNLIVHNRLRTADKKPLRTSEIGKTSKDVIRYGTYSTLEEETSAVANDILNRNVPSSDCVILARTARLLEQSATALRASGLEAYVARRKSDFDSPVVRILINVMRLANARHDRDLLRRVCVAWKDFASKTIEVEDTVAAAALAGGDFLRSWIDMAARELVDAPAREYLDLIRRCLVDRLDFLEIVQWFLSDGWTTWNDQKSLDVAEEVETWRELHGQLMEEYSSSSMTLNLYLQKIDLASKSPIAGPKAVRCLTVHGSKGLEFKHVYLIGMAQEVLPSYQALKKGASSSELEEERRGCFVAITRVQETLTLTRALQYNGYSKSPSQFLHEMGIAERTA